MATFAQARHPLFWVKPDRDKFRRPWPRSSTCRGIGRWKSITSRPRLSATGRRLKRPAIRLPSEDEWYRLRDLHDIPDQPYWEKAPGNINLEHCASSCPVNTFGFGDFFDIIGNVWQWTETPITGFDGFEVHPYYDDFSTPTFDTQHNLIKGGSWISTGNEVHPRQPLCLPASLFPACGIALRGVEPSR